MLFVVVHIGFVYITKTKGSCRIVFVGLVSANAISVLKKKIVSEGHFFCEKEMSPSASQSHRNKREKKHRTHLNYDFDDYYVYVSTK